MPNELKRYRLINWEINGEFESEELMDFQRTTSYEGKELGSVGTTPKRYIKLIHTAIGTSFPPSESDKRLFKMSMLAIYETGLTHTIEQVVPECTELGYKKMQELADYICKDDYLKFRLTPHEG